MQELKLVTLQTGRDHNDTNFCWVLQTHLVDRMASLLWCTHVSLHRFLM
uniref:Uncharacterized protein n=1 Tax=Arundo donax TaxID=35708 RepID=A0A0A8XZL1_ARUDO